MSMEQAILELAKAVVYLADSNRRDLNRRDLADSARPITTSTPAGETFGTAGTEAPDGAVKADTLLEDKAAELAQATADRAAAARKAEKEDAARIEAKIRAEMARIRPDTLEEQEETARKQEAFNEMLVKNAAEMEAAHRAKKDAEKDAAAARKAEGEDAARIEAKIKEVKGTTTAEAAANQKKIEAEREAELEAAVRKVEAAVTKVEADATPLNYEKDVRPVLLAAIKKGKRAEIEAMLAKFGVTKADQLKPEQLAPALAEAQKLAA